MDEFFSESSVNNMLIFSGEVRRGFIRLARKTLCLASTPKVERYYLESLEFRVSFEVDSCEVVSS